MIHVYTNIVHNDCDECSKNSADNEATKEKTDKGTRDDPETKERPSWMKAVHQR